MSAIDVRDVGKRYRRPAGGHRFTGLRQPPWKRVEHWALRDVSVTVPDRETIGVIGANGSGKSTLLRLVAGVTAPTTGTVDVGGDVGALLTLGESFHPELTGEENAYTGLLLSGFTPRGARARVGDVAAFAGLDDEFDRALRTFSDGMRVRLAFAVAVQTPSPILLVDEVLAVGDLSFQEKCLTHLEQRQAEGATVVITSHDLSQVRRLARRTLWLDHGRVHMIDDTEAVIDAYRLRMDAGATSVPTDVGTIRKGSGPVAITAVRWSTDGDTLRPGSPLRVEIDLDLRDDAAPGAHDVVLSVSLHTDGEYETVVDVASDADHAPVGAISGPATVAVTFEALDLPPARYWLDVGVYDATWERTYDYIWEVAALDVHPPDAAASRMRRTWRRI